MLCNGLPVPEPEPTVVPAPTPTPTPVAAATVDRAGLRLPDENHTSTRLFGLRLENVEAGSTVTVRCAKGCPLKSWTKRNAKGTISLARFASRRLKPGTTIKITLTEPGKPTRAATLKIRARRAPSVTGSI